jgi:hypothetical protein
LAAFLAGLAAAAFFFLAMDRSSEMKKLGEIPLPIVASSKSFGVLFSYRQAKLGRQTTPCRQAKLGRQAINRAPGHLRRRTGVERFAPLTRNGHPITRLAELIRNRVHGSIDFHSSLLQMIRPCERVIPNSEEELQSIRFLGSSDRLVHLDQPCD